jgi:hypothetical protein
VSINNQVSVLVLLIHHMVVHLVIPDIKKTPNQNKNLTNK